jgi:hypothetical protein
MLDSPLSPAPASTSGYAFGTAAEAPRIRRHLREDIRTRTPRPGAVSRLSISSPPSQVRFVDYTRLSGPREDVLDYAAFLFATDTGWGETALELIAIEDDQPERLTLVLGKPF